ncbi:MAG: dockerin type I domain-containing protein [Candidatus Zixiibacteriota bacterium]
MFTKIGAALLVWSLALSATVTGQGQDPKDQGLADTVRIDISLRPDANTNQLNVTIDLYLFNDVQNLSSVAIGFKWINDQLTMTNAAFTPLGQSAFDFIRFLYRNNNKDSTNKYDRFQFTGTRLAGTGLLASMTAKHVARYDCVLSSWTVFDSLVVDTAQVFGAGLEFVDFSNVEYRPRWAGRVVVYDANRPVLSNLLLSEDTLRFEATQGLGNPPPQVVEVTSDQLPLAFNVVESIPWLLKSPSSGTTPQPVTISITTTGLVADTYFDSVRFESAGASNSPQFLYVELVVNPQQPAIGVDKTIFFFNAIVGGANPPNQTLGITNTGQSTLNWSVTNSEAWLSLNPPSGVNAGTVTLSVNTTGLSFGQYSDTIVVSDPAATNSPVKVPVRLSMASDLPILVIDSIPNYWPVDWAVEGPMFIRSFGVRNGGPGSLNFWVETSSPNILNVTPDTSSAPDSVSLLFYFPTNPGPDPLIPDLIIDTVWVYSNEAINSPVMVECWLRFPVGPAVIGLSTDAIEFNVYECYQGYGNSLPTSEFTVTNDGYDEPMAIEIVYNSERFQIIGAETRRNAPYTYQVNAKLPDVPTGTYTDTIWVTSLWAMNKPQMVVVTFNFLPTPQPPTIFVPGTPLKIAYQEDSGPQLYEGLQIANVNPGCMNWEISENLSWLTPVTTQGAVPDESPLLIDATGYTLGEYAVNISILSPSASNNPLVVPLLLQVWKLRGDVNWNGEITVQDVAWMIDYLFELEHAPMPVTMVGDVDCDGNINIGDIAAIIDYLYVDLVPLCSNPY